MKKIIVCLFVLATLILMSCGGGKATVPASWNGDYAAKMAPDFKILTIKDGKIFSSAAGTETEIFPSEFAKTKYKMSSSETEVKAEYQTNYIKFTLNGEDLVQEVTGGVKVEYVKMK